MDLLDKARLVRQRRIIGLEEDNMNNGLSNIIGLDDINADINANIVLDNESLLKLFILGLGLIVINIAITKIVK